MLPVPGTFGTYEGDVLKSVGSLESLQTFEAGGSPDGARPASPRKQQPWTRKAAGGPRGVGSGRAGSASLIQMFGVATSAHVAIHEFIFKIKWPYMSLV